MAQQHINLGTAPAGSDGDTNRTGWTKAESNFNELYEGMDLLSVLNAGILGWITGLRLEWVGPTALTVSSGCAYIESLGELVKVPSAIAKTGLTMSANFWYHVYLFVNGSGDPDIEVVATPPADPYNGTARSKSGATSRRYLGSVRVGGSGEIVRFAHANQIGLISYLVSGGQAPLRLVTGSTSTSTVSASATLAVPLTACALILTPSNLATSGIFRVSNTDSAATPPSAAMFDLQPNTRDTLTMGFITRPPTVTCAFLSAPSGGTASIDVNGYYYER